MENSLKAIGIGILIFFICLITVFLFKVFSVKAGMAFIFPVVTLGIVFTALHFTTYRHHALREELLKSGKSAEAVILNAKQTGSKNNQSISINFSLEVSPVGIDPFKANVRHSVDMIDMIYYGEGSIIAVKYDSTDKTRVAIVSYIMKKEEEKI
jgi:hypothetical protein